MTIYHYDQETGELIGQGEAEVSPLDPENYLIPKWSTPIPPPETTEGKIATFTQGSWILVDPVVTDNQQDSTN
jgi:hypothetical protein